MGCLAGLAVMLSAIASCIAYVTYSDTDKRVAIVSGIVAAVSAVVALTLIQGSKKSTSWRVDPATEKQKSFADDLGIRYPRNITKGKLSALIDEALEDER